MVDLHRHDEFSTFDGFGKAADLAAIAKENGLTALGISNHGNVNGLVEHYLGCKENGIKPILGCEAYFQPKFSEDKAKYHICLFAKNKAGYANLNRLLYYANKENFYYKPVVTLQLLKKYNEGIICTTACIAGYISSNLIAGKYEQAKKCLLSFKKIFSEDLYVEIMPYKLTEKGLQEKANEELIKLANECEVEMILTSDSHYGRKEDFDTYIKMHEIKSGDKGYDFAQTYSERYMPKKNELFERFIKLHKDVKLAKRMKKNLEHIEDIVEDDILGTLDNGKLIFDKNIDAEKCIIKEIKQGLKHRGKYNKQYLSRAKKEYAIIKKHGFSDYFLIVQDYIKFAKRSNIKVGPGRGSVCNSLVAFAMGITEVDPIYFGMDFTRFLREDKVKMPDIDMDFETSERQRVIDYIIQKYPGRAAQICSYGLYKVDNCLNDLFKVCNVNEANDKNSIKNFVSNYIDKDSKLLDSDLMKEDIKYKRINAEFDNILKHFIKMYRKVRYIGTHAAGVAIVGTDILDFVSIEKRGNKFSCVYDLSNLERLNILKFDMLGLKTMSEIRELEELTGEKFSYDWLEDEEVYDNFRKGNTDGVFQFEKKAAKMILEEIEADCFEDVASANAMNRPGPLSLGMPEKYAHNKKNVEDVKNSIYYEQTKDTYGTIVFQEQITAICRSIGKLSFPDSDKVLKFMKGTNITARALKEKEESEREIINKFVSGCKENGISKKEALDIFDKITVYSFNKGHAVGYSMISLMHMYYKLYHPEEFWYIKLKYAPTEGDLYKYKINAVNSGSLIFLPHVNASAKYSLNKVGSDLVIQEGLENIKNVGAKAAEAIELERVEHGDYKNYKDVMERVPKRILNARVIKALEESGALEFNNKKYMKRVEQYNSSLFGR